MAISLALIVVLGLAADIVFRKFKLPGLVGMLIVGVLARIFHESFLNWAFLGSSSSKCKVKRAIYAGMKTNFRSFGGCGLFRMNFDQTYPQNVVDKLCWKLFSGLSMWVLP